MQDNGAVLAIGAHPDDIEFQCAGTLALLKRLGYRITMATLTPGDLGSMTEPPEAIMQRRRREAGASAAILGAEYRCLEERDFCIDYDDPTRRKVTRLLREVNPFLVITHSPVDYLIDHEATSRLVRQACFAGSIPNYRTPELPPDRLVRGVPYLYYMDALEGAGPLGERIPATTLVDISSTIDTKKQMLASHSSQRDWLREQHGMDEYMNAMLEWATKRGSEIGAAFAEGFRQHLGHGYPHHNFLAQRLGAVEKQTG